MNREEAIEKWVIPALKNTWNEKKCDEILEALEQQPCTVTEFADRCMECEKILGDMIKPCDAVSRKAAIDACLKGLNRKEMVSNIKALPSVTPAEKQEPCTDSISRQAYDKGFDDGLEEGLKVGACEDCISRQDAIDLADELKDDLPDDDHLSDMVMSHNEGILEYQTKLSLLPPVTPAENLSEWIPVSERLPDEKDYCLCCDKYGYITIGFINKWSKEWCFDDDEVDIDVLAWMPLPEPYKSESEEVI